MLQDLRYSVRTLAKHPAFVIAAALVLALGISVNTALFSIVYSVLFRPLPVHEPDELLYLYTVFPRQPDRPGPSEGWFYEYLRDHNEAFSALTGHWGVTHMLTADGETDSVRGEWVLGNYFQLLGVSPAFGRTLSEADDDPAVPERSIVISHRLWMRRFKADRSVIGKPIRLSVWSGDPATYTVVGVMNPAFKGLSDPWTPSDFWITFAQSARPDPRSMAIGIIARRKPGVSVSQAKAIVAEQGQQWVRVRTGYAPNQSLQRRFIARPANSVRTPFDPGAAVVPVRLAAALTVVVATVLLISAANIAALVLARSVSRTGEIAIRLVIGAGAWRVGRQLLFESLILALCGGALGLIGAGWLLHLFRAFTPNQFGLDVAIDSHIVVFVVIVCVGVGILIGIVPAVKAGRLDLLSSLPGTGVGSGKRTAPRLRHWVVIPQLALSLVLLLVAAIHVRALVNIELADLGYRTEGAVVLNFHWRMEPLDRTNLKVIDARNAARSRLLYRLLVQRIGELPGTDGVALTTNLPLRSMPATSYSAVSQDDFLAGDSAGIGTLTAAVSPQYFHTMGMSVLRGRDFDDRDGLTAPHVAIISASIAERLWPGRDAVGRFVAAKNSFPSANETIDWLQIVGVVNDVDPVLRDSGHSPFIYTPLSQEWRMSAGTLVARVAGDPQDTILALKEAVAGADASAEVFRVQTMRQMVGDILYPRRMTAGILAASGLIGLVLAIVGLYGVIAYSLAQRVHELGVRVALGAERNQIIAMVLRDGLRLAAIGSVLGVCLAYPALRVASNLFVAVPALDVVAFTSVPLLLTAVVLLACYIPSRRAASVDPMTVLRQL